MFFLLVVFTRRNMRIIIESIDSASPPTLREQLAAHGFGPTAYPFFSGAGAKANKPEESDMIAAARKALLHKLLPSSPPVRAVNGNAGVAADRDSHAHAPPSEAQWQVLRGARYLNLLVATLGELIPFELRAARVLGGGALAGGSYVTRYRANVLDLPIFVTRRAAYTKELLTLLTVAMERTQVSFEGFATCLRISSPDSPSLDRRLLERVFFRYELLRFQRDGGLCLSTPSNLTLAGEYASAPGGKDDHAMDAALVRDLPELRAFFRKTWAQNHDQHCPRRGKCKLMVVDGNAKICRPTCESRHRFYHSLPGYGWVHDGCTNRPAVGESLCVDCMQVSAQRSAGSIEGGGAQGGEVSEGGEASEGDEVNMGLCAESSD